MRLKADHRLDDQEEVPEVRLWQAVLASTVDEWVNGPLRISRQAEAFLFENKEDFRRVCDSANINADRLREKLWGYRKRAQLAHEARRTRN